MSGLLGRLADLAGRTLATAWATRPARPDHQQAVEAPPDAALGATSTPAESHVTAAAPEVRDRVSLPGGVEPHASSLHKPDAPGPERPAGGARPATPEPVVAPRPTADRPAGGAAEAATPTAEERPPEAGRAMQRPAIPGADAPPSSSPPKAAPRPLHSRPTPEEDSTISPGADRTGGTARPGLLRDVEIRVLSAVDAARGARAGREPDDAIPELKERWRDLGARLRATHPPVAPVARSEGAGKHEASTRPEAAEPPAVAVARYPGKAAPGEATAAQRGPELIIRHLEIRIVAAAKEPAAAATSRSPAPVTGAWQTAARRYLRL
jgi:hypothetical protein